MTRYNKEKAQEYYQQNKEKILARNKEWQLKNKDKMREYGKKYKAADNPTYQEYSERTFAHRLWISCKHNAAKQNLPFDLEESDIIIPDVCPYLGFPLTKLAGSGHVDTNASVDKIIPELGYVKGNIRIISRQANRMKNNASLELLMIFAENVLKLHSN